MQKMALMVLLSGCLAAQTTPPKTAKKAKPSATPKATLEVKTIPSNPVKESSGAVKELSNAVKEPAKSSLSPDFKKQAWRAIDAIERINNTLTAEKLDANEQGFINEANKAVDEAKYVSSTPLDKQVLEKLQMAVLMAERQGKLAILDPHWKKASDARIQCETEAKVEVTPDALSPLGLSQGSKNLCTKMAISSVSE